MSIESVMPSSHLILCRPLLLLPQIPPSIRVFSNESILCMRWPKYWSFSFSISPSIYTSFPGGSGGKESACHAGDPGSIPGWKDSLEKGMATHSSNLTWRIPWTEEPGGLQSMGQKESDTTEWLTLSYTFLMHCDTDTGCWTGKNKA